MVAKVIQMHGLENVDKTDDTTEETTPLAPTKEPSASPAEAQTSQPAPLSGSPVMMTEVDTLPPSSHAPSLAGGVSHAPVAPISPQVRTENVPASYVPPAMNVPSPQPEARRSVSFIPFTDFREHKYRVPRTFRFDVDLLEYIERHEKYRAALEDPRTFTEKVNDWVRSQMNEENPVLLQAEADVMGLRSGRRSLETIEIAGGQPQPSPESSLAPQTQPSPSLEASQAPSTVPASTTIAPTVPPKKAPNIWDLEKQIKNGRIRGNSGTL